MRQYLSAYWTTLRNLRPRAQFYFIVGLLVALAWPLTIKKGLLLLLFLSLIIVIRPVQLMLEDDIEKDMEKHVKDQEPPTASL